MILLKYKYESQPAESAQQFQAGRGRCEEGESGDMTCLRSLVNILTKIQIFPQKSFQKALRRII